MVFYLYGGANFTVLVKFQNEDGHLTQNRISGISFESFLKRFSNFEVIIEINKKTHIIEFNSNETKKWITSVQMGLMMPDTAEKAKVLKESVIPLSFFPSCTLKCIQVQ